MRRSARDSPLACDLFSARRPSRFSPRVRSVYRVKILTSSISWQPAEPSVAVYFPSIHEFTHLEHGSSHGVHQTVRDSCGIRIANFPFLSPSDQRRNLWQMQQRLKMAKPR